ncbi:MAG: polysaccharide pyruvyl transferase family protein [Opitutus sp.]
MNRRTFLRSSLVLALSAGLSRAEEQRRRPRILLCSAWQVVNIGDIAHTPGALALLEQFVPEAEITLWAFNPLTPDARSLILRRFPRVQILESKLDEHGEPADAATVAAIAAADFFLHGSGPAMLGWKHAEAFRRRTGRGFGVYGVTYGLYGTPERETLSRAEFVFFRDSVSLARAKKEGVHAPVMEWAPDTAFAFDENNESRADTFLAAHDLKPREFLCCISRYRNTPFWTMRGKNVAFDAVRHARNQEKKNADHAPLLAAITAVVRETSMRVLLCPEDESQMAITREMLWERLPEDVRRNVVWRETFWLPDEAASVYQQSAGLFGHEMHSPILCIGRGIPAIVCRWAEQSSKGTMWRDIGLGDWLFDLDNPEEAEYVAPAVLALARSPDAARTRAEGARKLVQARYRETMSTVASCLVAHR